MKSNFLRGARNCKTNRERIDNTTGLDKLFRHARNIVADNPMICLFEIPHSAYVDPGHVDVAIDSSHYDDTLMRPQPLVNFGGIVTLR